MFKIKLKRDEKGSVLMLTMVGIAALLTVGTVSLTANVQRSKNVINLKGNTQAFYIAEAGLQAPLARLSDDLTYRPEGGILTESFASGNYSVTVQDSDDDASIPDSQVKVSISSIYSDKTAEIEVYLKIEEGGTGGMGQHAVYSAEEIDIDEGVNITGNIYTEDRFRLRDGAFLNGDIYITEDSDEVDIDGSFIGTIYSSIEHEDPPSLPFTDYKTFAQSGTTVSETTTGGNASGDLTLNGNNLTGQVYYVPGAMALNNLVATNSFFYVEGQVTIGNVTLTDSSIISAGNIGITGAYLNDDDFSAYVSNSITYPLFAAKGRLDLGNDSSFSIIFNGLFYAEDEIDIRVDGDITIYGALISSAVGSSEPEIELRADNGGMLNIISDAVILPGTDSGPALISWNHTQ